MKLRPLLIFSAVAVCIALVYLASKTTDGTGGAARIFNRETVGAPNLENPETLTKISQLNVSPGTAAAGRVNALRKSHLVVEENLSATLMLSESEAAEFAEVNNRRTAEAEKNLIDSLTSLTQHLVNEQGSTTSVIDLLREEQDPQLMILIAQSLGEAAAAIGEDFPYESLADIIFNDSNFDRRQAAMLALGYMRKVPDALRLQMTEFAQSAPSPELRGAAVDLMGQWMNHSPELAETITEALLGAREATDHPFVRGVVIQTIGNSNAPLTPRVFEAMTDALQGETVAGNRSLAAVALGSGATPENHDAVITALEAGYQVETNLDTRRHIITQIAKAARGDAASYLQRLPTPDPLLAQDVSDYMEIMAATDPTDWGAIWEQKSDRDSMRNTYPVSDGGHGGNH